jgi:hypothetical protein
MGEPTGRAVIEYRCGSGRDDLLIALYVDRGEGDGLWRILCSEEILNGLESIDRRLTFEYCAVDREEPY